MEIRLPETMIEICRTVFLSLQIEWSLLKIIFILESTPSLAYTEKQNIFLLMKKLQMMSGNAETYT